MILETEGHLELMQEKFPKCPICGSTNGYKFSGIIGKYAQCLKCKTKWQFFVKEKRISELKLHGLPKDGSAVYTITSTKAPLFTTIGERIPTAFWKNLELDKEVNWEFLSKNVSSDVSKAVFREKGEKLLYQWEGTRRVLTDSVTGGKVHAENWETGILLLSTQKLRWLERRVRTQKVQPFLVVYEMPLQEIRGISGETGNSDDWEASVRVLMDMYVVDKQGEHKFRLHYAFLEMFKPIIEKAVEIRKKEVEAEKKKERLHVMLDFSFLKTYMEKGGLIMQVLKCPHCSGTIEFPESGTKIKCSYCGKTIYAQDIFEKVRSLLE